MPRRNRIVRLVILMLFVAASSAARAQTTGWTVAPPFNSASPTGVQGTEFTPGPDILITGIGWFDDTAASPDGLAAAHEVGIFDAATMSLIASATIPAGTGAPKIDEFRFALIAPFRLTGGATYVIAGVADGDPGHVTLGGAGLTVDPDLTLGDWRSEPGAALAFPTTVVSSTDRFMGPNILFVPIPLPDACADVDQLDCDTVISADNSTATQDPADPGFSCAFNVQGQGTLWYRFFATDTSAHLSTCNTLAPVFDTMIAVYSFGSIMDPCNTLTELACNDDACGGLSELCVTGLSPGFFYYVQLASFPGTPQGPIELELTCPCPGLPPLPPNSFCLTAEGPLALATPTPGTTNGAVLDPAPDCDFFGVTAPNVWYEVVGTGNTMTASLCSPVTTYDSKLTVYCGDCGVLECVANNDDLCGLLGLQSELSWCSELGRSYKVMVHGFSNTNVGDFELEINDDGTPCGPPTGNCPPPCATCPGDTSGDGILDGVDVQSFVDCYISSVAMGGVPAPGCGCVDANGDAAVDQMDIDDMVSKLLAASPCP